MRNFHRGCVSRNISDSIKMSENKPNAWRKHEIRQWRSALFSKRNPRKMNEIRKQWWKNIVSPTGDGKLTTLTPKLANGAKKINLPHGKREREARFSRLTAKIYIIWFVCIIRFVNFQPWVMADLSWHPTRHTFPKALCQNIRRRRIINIMRALVYVCR